MLIDHFPLVGLRLTTPRLELRLSSAEELAAPPKANTTPGHDDWLLD